MEPLTMIDARNPATVGAWVSRASLTGQAWWMVLPAPYALDLCDGGCLVSMSSDGLWESATWEGAIRSHVQHEDRDALVAYVNAWARNTTNGKD